MNEIANRPKARLLVVTSMFPRWQDDSEPGFVFELSRRLTSQFEVRVLAPHAKGSAVTETMDGVEVVRYRYAPEPLESLAYGGGIVPKLRKQPWKWLLVPFFFLAQYWALRRQLKLWQPDVIHAHWIIPQGMIAAAACGARGRPKLVVTSHGGDLFALNGIWLNKVKRYVLDRSDAVTVVSQAMRDVIRDLGGDASKVRVEPMGVDLRDRFTPDTRFRRSDHEVLFVGRLAEKKGLSYLLDAVPEILARHPAASFVIAGFGPEENALRAQATALGIDGSVNFIGPVPQSGLPELYRRAAVFVAPFVQARSGDQEGFGLVVVEAIGCGTPIIVSALPAVRDVVGAHTECLVEPANSNALAEAVTRVLDNPKVAVDLGDELRRAVLAKFDWEVVALRYSQLLQSVIQPVTIS